MKALLFDLDGTLVKIGFVSSVSHRHYLKLTAALLFRVLPRFCRTAFIALLNVIEGAYLPSSLFNKELLALMKKEKKKGTKIGIVSSNTHKTVLACMNKAGLKKSFFDVIVAVDETLFLKPDPESLNKALKKLGVKARNAVYYGDHWVDEAAAKAAGTSFVHVNRVKWRKP
ncbi:MAG: HAD-IA family hydrolase [Candidatus Micrarchaeota archaeon]